ncbi:MAG TPA: Phenylacetic acid catabolic protein [Drouetiella sp.]|jgi:ring-1,2-phenylacetyl-CoA epoxidase subunit PaaA
MAQIQQYDLVDEDRELIKAIERGSSLVSFEKTTPKFRELASGLLFQFADSQLAGAAGYNNCLNWGPTLDDRIALATIVVEKMDMAKKTYAILASQNLNVEKYFESHSWDAKVLRGADVGFRRASWDKRLNALIYPLESWVDMAIFAHLMSSMTCYTLNDFAKCSFAPLKSLADGCLIVEKRHEAFGENQLEKLARIPSNTIVLQSSLNYWFPRVATSFGTTKSLRNDLYRQFHLKAATNTELQGKWTQQIQALYEQLKLKVPILNIDNAATCN